MDKSIFEDKSAIPTDQDLKNALGGTFPLWNEIRDYVIQKYPGAVEDWNCPGKNYGWSFRIKDKKRAIIYLLPRDGHFKAAFVFGENAAAELLKSDISSKIKKELEAARVYAEGRGIRVEIKDGRIAKDIKKLIDIKLSY